MKKGFIPVLILFIVAAVLILSAGMVYYKSTGMNWVNTRKLSTAQPSPTPVKLTPTPSIAPGLSRYVDEELRYGFSYPSNQTVNKCPDLHCASIRNLSLVIDILESSDLGNLENSDLYCSASGPTGYQECKNTKVENYTNSLGLKGFKVYRQKTIVGGINAGKFNDEVYVFNLPEVVKGPGLIDYAAVLLYVENPSPSNLSILKSIADSFYTF